MVAGLACAALLALAWWQVRTPSWVVWEERSLVCDLDGNGLEEQVKLTGRRVAVSPGTGGKVSETPGRWQVSDVWVGDVTGDGTPELVLLIWRQGDYGDHHPFWEAPDRRTTRQHLCVLGYDGDGLHLVWESSDIGFEVASLSVDSEGHVHLVRQDTGEDTVWRWPGWGFERIA